MLALPLETKNVHVSEELEQREFIKALLHVGQLLQTGRLHDRGQNYCHLARAMVHQGHIAGLNRTFFRVLHSITALFVSAQRNKTALPC